MWELNGYVVHTVVPLIFRTAEEEGFAGDGLAGGGAGAGGDELGDPGRGFLAASHFDQ